MSLVEHASMMRAAVPVLKIPFAWICLFLNVFIPGLGKSYVNFYELLFNPFIQTGTILSGWLCLCFGHPRFSQSDNWRGRIGTFIINIIVGISQAFTIIFCLVGWGWSIWWGMMMVELASECHAFSLKCNALFSKSNYFIRKTQKTTSGCCYHGKCGGRHDFE